MQAWINQWLFSIYSLTFINLYTKIFGKMPVSAKQRPSICHMKTMSHDFTSLNPCPVSRTVGGNHLIFNRLKHLKHTLHTQKRFKPPHQSAR